MGLLVKELIIIIGPLKFKMAEICHLENREIISQRKTIRFWRNLVHNTKFGIR